METVPCVLGKNVYSEVFRRSVLYMLSKFPLTLFPFRLIYQLLRSELKFLAMIMGFSIFTISSALYISFILHLLLNAAKSRTVTSTSCMVL